MAAHVEPSGLPLISCPVAYSESLKTYHASKVEPGKRPTLECIEEHVATLISDCVGDPLESHSPCCILGVGSGDGRIDLSFIEMLCKVRRDRVDKLQLFQLTVEPDENRLEIFRAKAEDLPESLKSAVDITFEWSPSTYQEYAEQKRNDIKFDVVHFFHSIYFAGLESALEHCYEKDLGTKGIIICSTGDEESPFVKYSKVFSSQNLILEPGQYYSNKEVREVAKKNGWKYVECPGESVALDITNIFDHSSVKGNLLLDFLTHRINVGSTTSQENLQKILKYWENECAEDGDGRKIVNLTTRTSIIFKGF